MRRLTLLALAAIVGGVALLGYSAAIGQGQVHLVVVFPVFTGTGLLPFLGMLLIFAGIFLGFWSLAGTPLAASGLASPEAVPTPPAQAAPPTGKRFGGVVLLGPIPIVFGSDAKMAKWMLVLGIVLTLLLIALFFLVRP